MITAKDLIELRYDKKEYEYAVEWIEANVEPLILRHAQSIPGKSRRYITVWLDVNSETCPNIELVKDILHYQGFKISNYVHDYEGTKRFHVIW